ncbi:MAG TPA: penicillin-binding protein 2 [Fimbriimonadaceae bacterium]|nr:penicillin-binding protein 2 [Fimbriimonadaceae bacterium]
MSVIHTPRRPNLDLRIMLFPVVIFALLFVIFVRLWYVQIVLAPRLTEKAEVFGKSFAPIPAPRGLIEDRNGKLIAGIESQLVLTATPAVVLKNQWVLDKVARLLEGAGSKTVSSARLLRKTRDGSYKPLVPTPIYAGVPVEVVAKITEAGEALPGIGIENQPARYYPDPNSFSHLLGYVWVPGPDDVKRAEAEHRKMGRLVGKGGLEWVYEAALTGTDGYEATLLDSKRRPVRIAERTSPIPGKEVILGLDADLQQTAVKALGSFRGAVVALDPNTGEVLCMASTPTFDLSLFRNGISQEDFDQLNQSPDHPFINRAIGSAFSPGSTFKIVTTVAAMRAGVFDPNRTIFCAGGYKLGRQFFRCLSHHGPIQFSEALEKSCNTYFSDLAMRAGKDELRQTALDMGFFCKTGLDLPYERSGLIPTDEWLARVKRTWVPGYTVLTGIGQGDVLTTPLQMADLAAFVANSGMIYRPHLVRGFRSSQSQEIELVKPEVYRRVDLPQSDWDYIRDAMVSVVEHGTAAGSKIPGLVWAGKTGSAEVKDQAKTNSWFIGYAPADHPRIAICVMVEAAGHGGEFAAPIAKQVVQRYLLPPRAAENSASALPAHSTPAESLAVR